MSDLLFRSPSEFQPFLEELCAMQQLKTVACKMHNARERGGRGLLR